MKTRCAAIVVLALSAGCADMSGLGGTSHFSCKAPVGVHCESLSATYYNSLANTPPDRRRLPAISSKPINGEKSLQAPTTQSAGGASGFAPLALRAPGREMRIWIKAWQDEDKDLADQSFVYLVVNEGQWRVAHVQQQERDMFARLAPPQSAANVESAAPAQPASPPPASAAPVAAASEATEPAIK